MKYVISILTIGWLFGCSSQKGKGITDINARHFVVDSLVLKSSVFNNTRRLRVLLPPDYFEQESVNKDYPVLYMNDGVMVFHAYQLEPVVHDLIRSGKIIPLIIVGIDNGASTFESTNSDRDRANEYLPWPDTLDAESSRLDHPKGELYPDFLIKEVMPLIDAHFRTDKRPENIGLGGASRGALISLFTSIKHPHNFGKLLLESPSLYVSSQQIIREAEGVASWPAYTYIGIGTAEGETEAIQKMAVNDAAKLSEIIKRNSADSKVKYYLENGATHDFEHFANRFPIALEFLYGK